MKTLAARTPAAPPRVSRLPSDGCEAFAVGRHAVAVYNEQDCSCTCREFAGRGDCAHLDAVRELRSVGLI